MWVFTKKGMVSVVQHRDYPTKFIVRARTRDVLETFAGEIKVHLKETPEADYPFRIQMDKDDFFNWFFVQCYELDYDNFKASIEDENYALFCGAVWEHGRNYQDLNERIPERTANTD